MTTTTSVSFDLSAGERLLWSGAPKQGLVLRPSDLMLIPFGLFWAGFSVFWEVTAIKHAPWFFALWGIPFLLIGVFLVAGRFFVDAWIRRGTVYGLTTDRVMIASRMGLQSGVRSLSLSSLTNVQLLEKSNGLGTISFGMMQPMYGYRSSSNLPGLMGVTAFEMIPDAKHVYDLFQDAQHNAAHPAAKPQAITP